MYQHLNECNLSLLQRLHEFSVSCRLLCHFLERPPPAVARLLLVVGRQLAINLVVVLEVACSTGKHVDVNVSDGLASVGTVLWAARTTASC